MSRRHFMRSDTPIIDEACTLTETEIEEAIKSEVNEENLEEEFVSPKYVTGVPCTLTKPKLEESNKEKQLIKSLAYIHGKVVDCKKLNVRPAPFTTAEPLCTIPVGAPVTIDLNKSTDEWYAVCTEAGVEGYCMQKYIVTE